MEYEYGIAVWKQGEIARIENFANKEWVSYSFDEADGLPQFSFEQFQNAIATKGYTVERDEIMPNGEHHFYLIKRIGDD